jgi:hypothetical protein
MLGVQQDGQGKGRPKRSRRAKSAPSELPSAEAASEEGAASTKKTRRRGKEPDPNAPPVFGKAHCLVSLDASICGALILWCTIWLPWV